MGVLNQLYYATKRVIVDGKTLITRLISFIFMIALLGTAFGSSFEAASIDIIKVAYFSADEGENGEAFFDALVEIESIKSMVEFVKVSSFDEGENLVYDEEAGAFIYLPANYTNDIEGEDTKGTAEVYYQKYSGVNATIIQCVMDSFTNGMNAEWVVYNMGGTIDGFDIDIDSVESIPISKTNQTSAVQYYAVAMLLLLILYGAEYGCFGMSEDYVGVIGDRIKASPLKASEQYIGKLIGFSLATFVQAIIVMIFTSLVFGVTWGKNLPLMLFAVLTYCFLSNIFGMMIIAIFRDLKKAGPAVFVVIFVFTFLAGGFIATEFGGLEKLSPSYYAKQAIFNLIYDGRVNVTLNCILIMWAIIAVFTAISLLAARRKRA